MLQRPPQRSTNRGSEQVKRPTENKRKKWPTREKEKNQQESIQQTMIVIISHHGSVQVPASFRPSVQSSSSSSLRSALYGTERSIGPKILSGLASVSGTGPTKCTELAPDSVGPSEHIPNVVFKAVTDQSAVRWARRRHCITY